MTSDELNTYEPFEVFDIYMNQNPIEGVAGLNKLTEAMGYQADGFKYGSSFERFIADNHGVVEVITAWISDHIGDDWADSLCGEIEIDEDEDEDEQEELRRDQKHGLYGGKIDISN